MLNGDNEVKWETARLLLVRIVYAIIVGAFAGILHTWNLFFVLSGIYCGAEFLFFVMFGNGVDAPQPTNSLLYAFVGLYLSVVTISVFGGVTKWLTDLTTI